jgi:hypothetical protein
LFRGLARSCCRCPSIWVSFGLKRIRPQRKSCPSPAAAVGESRANGFSRPAGDCLGDPRAVEACAGIRHGPCRSLKNRV